MNIFTSSYKTKGFDTLITSLVEIVSPKSIIEFGVQQGHSTLLLAKGMKKSARLTAYDLFSDTYEKPPFAKTHADFAIAKKNLKEYPNVKIIRKNAMDVVPVETDMLHIDICNHYSNVSPLLNKWYGYVQKMIILEGGIQNHWQDECGFQSFHPLLEKSFLKLNYQSVVIQGTKDYAITILMRKQI